jgi:hypothetical protein
MKKAALIIYFMLISMLLVSCSSSRQAHLVKKTINGNWQLQTVVTESISGKFKMPLFNEADFKCFVGSSWSFNDQNSLGTYTISKNADECLSIKRNIRWLIYEATASEPKLLQFKRLDDQYKEIDEGAGFRFVIVKLDDKEFQLRSDFILEGKPASFVYNFVRN